MVRLSHASHAMPDDPRPDDGSEHGTVKWFDPVRGYGFIARDGEADLFVHQSEVAEGLKLAPGEAVRFEVGDGPKGLLAKRVRRAG